MALVFKNSRLSNFFHVGFRIYDPYAFEVFKKMLIFILWFNIRSICVNVSWVLEKM